MMIQTRTILPMLDEWIESIDKMSQQEWDEYMASDLVDSEEFSRVLSRLESQLNVMSELLNKGGECIDR